MLTRLKIATRINLTLALAVCGVIAAAAIGLWTLRHCRADQCDPKLDRRGCERHSIDCRQGAQIQGFTGAIAAAVEEQTAAAHEIAISVARAAEGSEKAAQSSGQVSQAAGQTKEQVSSLSGVSQRLSDVSLELSKAVDSFLAATGADLSIFYAEDPAAEHLVMAFAEAA